MKRIFYRRVINERDGIFVRHSQVSITDSGRSYILLYLLDVQRALVVLLRPSYFTGAEQGFRHTTANQFVIAIVYHHVTILEKGQFLHTFVGYGVEILLMRPSDVGQDAYRRTDDALKGFHFSHFGDAGFKETKFRPLVHEPNRQGDAYLRIIASRRTGNDTLGAKQLVNPFLHHRFSVASRNAYHRHIKTGTIFFGQALQCLQRMRHLQEVRIGILCPVLRQFAHHKITDAPFV